MKMMVKGGCGKGAKKVVSGLGWLGERKRFVGLKVED